MGYFQIGASRLLDTILGCAQYNSMSQLHRRNLYQLHELKKRNWYESGFNGIEPGYSKNRS